MPELSGKIWMRVTDRRSSRSEEVLVGADAPCTARHEKLLDLKAHVLFDPAADAGRWEGREERGPESTNAAGENSTRKISLGDQRARKAYVFTEPSDGGRTRKTSERKCE